MKMIIRNVLNYANLSIFLDSTQSCCELMMKIVTKLAVMSCRDAPFGAIKMREKTSHLTTFSKSLNGEAR